MALPLGENQYIYGLHDRGGEHLLIDRGTAKGWVLVTEEIRAVPSDRRRSNYNDLANRGLGVIVRLNHAYGPDGTIPHSSQYRAFAQTAANFVRDSPGCHIWIIGNEMNMEREQPRGEQITPRLYADCYRMCRDAIRRVPGHANDQVITGAIAPWNNFTKYGADPKGKYPANHNGDWIVYMRDLLLAIGADNCDGIAIHAYTHGYDPALVYSKHKMNPPFQNRYFNFYTYQDQMNIIPAAFRGLPVYLTESNGDDRWPNVNSGWVKNAYGEIDNWNKNNQQQIRCMILYRWSTDDKWTLVGKDQVHNDLRDAIRRNYQWRQTTITPQPPQPPIVDDPEIRTRTGISILQAMARLISNSQHPQPYGRRSQAGIQRIIIHHTASPSSSTIEALANYQVNSRKLPGITYHFAVTPNGTVYQTQLIETVTRHAGTRHSNNSVGIALIGNFTNDAPPSKQRDAVAALVAHLAETLNINADETTIFGYRDLTSTRSPGDTWPQWKNALIAKACSLRGGTDPQPPATPIYRTEFGAHRISRTMRTGQTATANITVKNTGSFTWVDGGTNPFYLGYHWYDANGNRLELPANFSLRTMLPREVAPGQSITLRARFRAPETAGRYRLRWDMAHENIAWFSSKGDTGLYIDVAVRAVSRPRPEPPTPDPPTPKPPTIDVQIQNVIASLPTSTTASPYKTRNLSNIKRLVIHHSGTSSRFSVQRLADYHVRRQRKPGILFHFCVNAQGEIFQTQLLETLTTHATTHSKESVGVCLMGNFRGSTPSDTQITAVAKLLAYLGNTLGLTIAAANVTGLREVANTTSPGTTWDAWKPSLVQQAVAFQLSSAPAAPEPTPPSFSPMPITDDDESIPSFSPPSLAPITEDTPSIPVDTPAPTKDIAHYMLFTHRASNSLADWDLVNAINYIGRFHPTVGFSLEEAKHAKYVTIVGDTMGVPGSADLTLRAAGCQVERLAGRTQDETKQILDGLVAANRRFRTLG